MSYELARGIHVVLQSRMQCQTALDAWCERSCRRPLGEALRAVGTGPWRWVCIRRDATDAEAWLTAYHAHVLATPSKPPPSFCGHLGKDPNPRTGRTTEVKALTKLLQNGTLCPLAGPFDAGEGPSKQQTGWSNINLPLHLPSMALRRRAIRVFVYTSRIHCTDHRRGMDLFQAKLHALFEAERRRPTSKRFVVTHNASEADVFYHPACLVDEFFRWRDAGSKSGRRRPLASPSEQAVLHDIQTAGFPHMPHIILALRCHTYNIAAKHVEHPQARHAFPRLWDMRANFYRFCSEALPDVDPMRSAHFPFCPATGALRLPLALNRSIRVLFVARPTQGPPSRPLGVCPRLTLASGSSKHRHSRLSHVPVATRCEDPRGSQAWTKSPFLLHRMRISPDTNSHTLTPVHVNLQPTPHSDTPPPPSCIHILGAHWQRSARDVSYRSPKPIAR